MNLRWPGTCVMSANKFCNALSIRCSRSTSTSCWTVDTATSHMKYGLAPHWVRTGTTSGIQCMKKPQKTECATKNENSNKRAITTAIKVCLCRAVCLCFSHLKCKTWKLNKIGSPVCTHSVALSHSHMHAHIVVQSGGINQTNANPILTQFHKTVQTKVFRFE